MSRSVLLPLLAAAASASAAVVVEAFTPNVHTPSSQSSLQVQRRHQHDHRRSSRFSPSKTAPSTTSLFDYADDGAPSDYDSEDLLPLDKEVTVDDNADDASIRDELKRELLLLSSITDRGAYATREELDIVIDLVAQLEALNPTVGPARECEGVWDLCFDSSGQLFRSSPFFQEIRAAVGSDNKDIALNFFNLHDAATVGSRIGRVRQIVSSDKLTSEVDIALPMLPGIPMKATGTVVTTADLKVVSDKAWDLQVDTTQVRGSNIPILDMDNLKIELPVGNVYKSLMQGSVPVFSLTTLYADEALRISRDEDEVFYVFVKES